MIKKNIYIQALESRRDKLQRNYDHLTQKHSTSHDDVVAVRGELDYVNQLIVIQTKLIKQRPSSK